MAKVKDATFTLKLEMDLRTAFMEAADELDRPASQIARELIRDYVARYKADRAKQQINTQ